MGRIVVVVDGSREHDRPLRWAVAEAGRSAPCTVSAVAVCSTEPILSNAPREPFFAWDPNLYPPDPTEPKAWSREQQQGVEARHHLAHQELERTLGAITIPAGVTVETRVIDHPHHADAVARMAVDAELVVLDAEPGPRGGVNGERLAHHLLRTVATPVVLVPPGPARGPGGHGPLG